MEFFQLVFEENNTIPFHDAHFPVTAQSRKTEIHQEITFRLNHF